MAPQEIDPNENPIRANRGIFVIVVALGALIVLGLGGLVYGIALKARNLGSAENVASESAQPTPAWTPGIVSITPDGNRVYLHVVRPDGGEVVHVYDADGRFLFEIDPGVVSN